MDVTVNFRFSMLMGEPVYVTYLQWQLKGHKTSKLLTELYREGFVTGWPVLSDKFVSFDTDLVLKMGTRFEQNASWSISSEERKLRTDILSSTEPLHEVGLFSSPGIVKGSGGEPSFNIPDSSDWDKVFEYFEFSRRIFCKSTGEFVNSELTKRIFKLEVPPIEFYFCNHRFNLSSYNDLVENQIREFEKKKSDKEAKNKQAQIDAFDPWKNQGPSPDNEETGSAEEAPSSRDFIDKQSGVTDWFAYGDAQHGFQIKRDLEENLLIESPSAKVITEDSVIWIEGKVPNNEGNYYLVVNGRKQRFAVDSRRRFKSAAILEWGDNKIDLYGEVEGIKIKKGIEVGYTGRVSKIRVTLLWDKQGDLDLHLKGPEGQHVYYSNKAYSSNNYEISLDVDNTSGYGPENISVFDSDKGSYSIEVVNYGSLNSVNATVHVFLDDEHFRTFRRQLNSSKEKWVVDVISLD
ncbi:YfaP family protein [Planctobacterium marinum]|uniref:Uncharacterized protein n=1 Tax=Planctobacterium marinum TaxID=1631968 RepID=A0AA48KPN3_9ALTE|nr:hypothetical protein MACH26_11490 [Planctobacterium marinum]